jgi:hypothetical protein
MRKGKKFKDVFEMIESKMTPAEIRRSNAKARKMLVAMRLAEFRKALRIDQKHVRGFTQPAVSKIEGRNDIKLSTLVEYCKALDADVTITAKHKSRKPFVLLNA